MLRSYRVINRHDVLAISECIGKGGISGTIPSIPPNTTFKYRPEFLKMCIANSYTKAYNNRKKKGGIIMATKSANILARVEPEVKEQAEEILSKLGIPASVVINMLYKQIIMTKSIPFSVALPKEPVTLDSMTTKEFNEVMETGLSQAKADQSRPAVDVIADLRRELQ